MTIVSWPEIEGFHNVRKHTKAYPEIAHGAPVTYRAKVKLHGTNAAIQCHADGRVVAQSRTAELTAGVNDNAGFARWVADNEDAWRTKNNMVIFGEWCGPGIQKGVAVNQIPNKIFAVFAARSLEDENTLIFDPEILKMFVDGIPNTHVLPWSEPTVEVDWSLSSEELAPVVEIINKRVLEIEQCDPWIEATFGVKGTGEGLVFYPTDVTHWGVENFTNLAFKAKGEAHRVVASPKAAQVDVTVAASIEQFVNLVLTEARLEQGATTVNGGSTEFDKRHTGAFVAWVLADVAKETGDELEAAGLDWKVVQKPLTDKARKWYLGRA